MREPFPARSTAADVSPTHSGPERPTNATKPAGTVKQLPDSPQVADTQHGRQTDGCLRPVLPGRKTFTAAASDPAIAVLLSIAAAANRGAKTTGGSAERREFYRIKAGAICALLARGAARVEELLLDRGLVTVVLVNGCRPHLPLWTLTTEAAAMLKESVDHRLGTVGAR